MEKYLPNRKALAGRLLMQTYKTEKEELISVLRDQSVLGLVSDGWSNGQGGELNCRQSVDETTSLTPGEDEQTGKYVANAIGVVIDDINNAVGRHAVRSVTTNSAPNMQKVWEILEKERQVCCNGCRSHALDLVVEQVLRLPWMDSGISRAVKLAKFIRNRSQLLSEKKLLKVKTIGEASRTLHISVPTRWFSSIERIKSVLSNRKNIRTIFKDTAFMKKFCKKNGNLFNEAITITLLQPLAEGMAVLERESCSISMVYYIFRNTQDVPAEVQQDIINSINVKWNFVRTDTMGISFLLDHTKKSADFVDDDFVVNISALQTLSIRLGEVKSEADKQQIANEAGRERHKTGSTVAFAVVEVSEGPDETWNDIPSSLANAHGSYMTMDFIHTKRRNRLDVKRVEKLAYIYANAGDEVATTNILYRLDDESKSEEESEREEESEDERGADEGEDDEAAVAFSFEQDYVFS
ncbi:LOW QUALITY PROTEIN: hypothetical protein PHMEG_00012945 [Phytophthora megakarya]|uniref:Uncharacterized protein n=1 Tax=Phytophthora megakarya TaxID=4795 RepID=A0A225W7H7_9STRA|nr:LOW QUALITY PROTEIN: hypothetical protein PHMEG_00012945 [Phytophthora megakarya]